MKCSDHQHSLKSFLISIPIFWSGVAWFYFCVWLIQYIPDTWYFGILFIPVWYVPICLLTVAIPMKCAEIWGHEEWFECDPDDYADY